jgi:hypothetical protein
MSLSTDAKDLKVPKPAGLIARSREAQWRLCRIETRQLKGAAELVEHSRRFWQQSFDRLAQSLHETQATRKSVEAGSGRSRGPAPLSGRREQGSATAGFDKGRAAKGQAHNGV